MYLWLTNLASLWRFATCILLCDVERELVDHEADNGLERSSIHIDSPSYTAHTNPTIP